MATPEQNALLLMQLFGNATEPIIRRGEADRQERLRRDLEAQQYQRAIQLADIQSARARELAGYTADRQDANARAVDARQIERDRAITERADKQSLAAIQRDDQKQKAAEDLQDRRLNAADEKRIKEAITKEYGVYVAEAENLGEEVLDRSEFSNDDNGLGKLTQIRAAQQRKRINRDQDSAAEALVGERGAATSNIQRLQREFNDLRNPSPKEVKFAKADALKAIQMAVESGDLIGAKKLTSSGIKKGINALAAGDDREAEAILGSDVKAAYDGAIQQRLLGLQSSKSQLQETQLKARELQQAVQNFDKFNTDLVKNAVTNPALARRITTQRTNPDALTAPAPAAARGPRSFDEITPPPSTAKPILISPQPTSSIGTGQPASPNMMSLMGGGLPQAPAAFVAPDDTGPVPVIQPQPQPVPVIQAQPIDVPVIQPQPSEPSYYPSRLGTYGNDFQNRTLTDPVAELFASGTAPIDQVSDPAKNRSNVVKSLMTLLHSDQYSNPEQRAYVRNRIYELMQNPNQSFAR